MCPCISMCYSLALFLLFCHIPHFIFFILLLVFRFLFSDKREKERVWICMGGVVRRIWEELGEDKIRIILC